MLISLVIISAASFLFFGISCLVSLTMQREFIRYGLAQFRPLVGTLQILGALGLLAGLHWSWLGQAAAGGLALLMFLGVVTRIRIHDAWWQSIPAVFYMILNTWICLVGY